MADVGDLVASYRLIAEIGGGGMGTVYRAHDERLDRDVALKLLAPRLSDDQTFRARFERESRIAGGLRHPNIVPVYDAGDWQGQMYLAMLHVEGPDLAAIIKREAPLAVLRVTDIVGQIASALDAAHAKGIVHRDIKPGNILLLEGSAPDGGDFAYLADFGLTRSSGDVTKMTTLGTFLGTLDYIAPEQIQGEQVDGRADQYALACTAFEMLTSAPPFRGDTDVALIGAHLYTPPPALATVRPDLPPEIGDVLARAMSKNADDRYATAGAFARALTKAGLIHAAAAATVVGPAPQAVTVLQPMSSPRPPVVPPAPIDQAGPPLPPLPPVGVSPASAHSGPRSGLFILGAVVIAAVLGAGAILALNFIGPGANATGSPRLASLLAAAATPSQLVGLTGVASPTADLGTPSPAISTTGVTPPPFPWAISISASATSVPVGEAVTIEAITNNDVTGTGFVIQIASLATGKPFNSCSNGKTCSSEANPGTPRLTTYLATVGPSAGPPLAQDSITVGWFRPGTSPVPPVSPFPSPSPSVGPGLGAELASGTWTVFHTPDLSAEVDGGQDIGDDPITRAYSLTGFTCRSATDCTAKFHTGEGANIFYRWDGNAFEFGPNAFHEDRGCGGVPGSFDVQQYVRVVPVEWDGVSPITHLQGFMTLTGTVNSTGVSAGCTNYFLRFTTDITNT